MFETLVKKMFGEQGVNVPKALEIFLNTLYEGIIVIDENCEVVFVNEAYSRILNISLEKVYGKNLAEIEPEANILGVLKTGEPIISSITTIKTLDVPIVYDAIPIMVENKIVGAMAVFRQIEDIVRLNKELKKVNLQNELLRNELAKYNQECNNEIVAVSRSMKEALLKANKMASTEMPVLIRGESGTGKEIIARSIHSQSLRNKGPFISVNCAAIPESLIESELFGYEKGAYTGANPKGKPGVFELAENGTIFLDEIGDMSLASQAKMLRVLEERKIKRVGGTREKSVNIRVIAATNQDLEHMIEHKTFRDDLYYRLNVLSICLPSLRQRKSDLRPLIDKILQEKSGQNKQLSEHALRILYEYDWPGNVRELENVIEHAIVMAEKDEIIQENHLPEHLQESVDAIEAEAHLANNERDKQDDLVIKLDQNRKIQDYVKILEKELLSRSLEQTGNKSEVIKKLGLSRRTFYQRLREYNL